MLGACRQQAWLNGVWYRIYCRCVHVRTVLEGRTTLLASPQQTWSLEPFRAGFQNTNRNKFVPVTPNVWPICDICDCHNRSELRHWDVKYSEIADSVHARTWSNEKTADMDGLRYFPDDPYYRLGPVHTCLYVQVRKTGGRDLFLNPLEWARAETGGADR